MTSPDARSGSSPPHSPGSNNRTSNDLNTSHDTTLSIFQESSTNWEEEILKHTRARRQRQETTLSSLQIHVQRLQAALSRESKRRVASIAAIEQKCQEQIRELENRLTERIDEQHNDTLQSLAILEARVAEVEARWERQLEDLESHVDTTANQLASQLDELKLSVEQETKAAHDRFESQSHQVSHISSLYDSQWKQERQDRLNSLHALTDRIKGQEDAATQQLNQLEARIGQELQLLNDELQQEAMERNQGDEEIVAALNRYMAQIQKSLKYM